jgi:hypothetical protein
MLFDPCVYHAVEQLKLILVKLPFYSIQIFTEFHVEQAVEQVDGFIKGACGAVTEAKLRRLESRRGLGNQLPKLHENPLTVPIFGETALP